MAGLLPLGKISLSRYLISWI